LQQQGHVDKKTWRKRKAGMGHASEQVHDMLDALLRMKVRRPGIISNKTRFSFALRK
jgi:hypothetical protein